MIRFHDDWEDDEPEDKGEAGEDDLDECPRCGRSIYDDSVRCPRCGEYLSREEGGPAKPWWVVAGALGCLAMVVYWILHPLG